MVVPPPSTLQTAIAVPFAATRSPTGRIPPVTLLSTVRCHVTGPEPQRS